MQKRTIELTGRYYKIFAQEGFPGDSSKWCCGYENISVDLEKCAFILVDVYSPLFTPEGLSRAKPAEAPYADCAVNGIAPALEAARAAKLNIIYTANSSPKALVKGSEIESLLRRTHDIDVMDYFAEPDADDIEYKKGPAVALKYSRLLAPNKGEHYIRKHAYSSFYQTGLHSLLQGLGIETIFLVGFDWSCCSLTTAIDAMYRNYKVIFLRDCVRAMSLPMDPDPDFATERYTTWAETFAGCSITSKQFVDALR